MYSFKEFCCKKYTFNAVSKTLTDKGMSANLEGILDELTIKSKITQNIIKPPKKPVVKQIKEIKQNIKFSIIN